jgi:hypothetical protein
VQHSTIHEYASSPQLASDATVAVDAKLVTLRAVAGSTAATALAFSGAP